MDHRELERLREIELRLRRLRKKRRKTYASWEKLNREKLDLDYEIRDLAEEKDSLQQGQLIFPAAL
jgi:hypothetical protein